MREVQRSVGVADRLVEGSRGSFGANDSPRPPEIGLLKDVVRVRREVFVSKDAPLEIGRVLAEAL